MRADLQPQKKFAPNVGNERETLGRYIIPLIIAIITAGAAAASNAYVAWYNAKQQRLLEQEKSSATLKAQELRSQHERVLEVIKTGNTAKAAENLEFALRVGLFTEPEMREKIGAFLQDIRE